MALPPSPMSSSPTQTPSDTHTVYGKAGYAQICTDSLLSFPNLQAVADVYGRFFIAFLHIPLTLCIYLASSPPLRARVDMHPLPRLFPIPPNTARSPLYCLSTLTSTTKDAAATITPSGVTWPLS